MSNLPTSIELADLELDRTPIAEDLMQELYQQYAPQGTRYAMSMTRHVQDAEEIVQEAFCKLVKANQLQAGDDQSFAPLFFTAIRNLSIDLLRKRKTRGGEISLHLTGEPVGNAFEGATEDSTEQRVEAAWRLMEQLPDRWRDALRLKVNGELSYQEIAAVLDATHSQVRTWIFRARKQMAAEMEKLDLNY